jgi:hypothetical protein
MPKVLTIAGVSILALGLVLGVALPSLAASDVAPLSTDEFEGRIVKGKVLSVDEEYQKYFKIQSGEEELTITVDENTKYYKLGVPGRIVSLAQHLEEWKHQIQQGARALAQHQMRLQDRLFQPDDMDMPESKPAKLKWLRPFGEESEFSDIAVGDRVVVWLAEEGNGNLLAERVLIVKPATYASVSGSITDVSSADKTITITPEDGDEPVTLDYNESAVFILNGVIEVETGQSAHAIYDSDNMLAKRVVVNQ